MKKRILSFCLPIGLLIYAVYQVVNHFMKISDVIASPICIVSIALMMIGLIYNGWCIGKRKNPYDKE